MFENLKKHLANKKADELNLKGTERAEFINAFINDDEDTIRAVIGDSAFARIFLYKSPDEGNNHHN